MSKANINPEIIFVDDNSRDGSAEAVKDLQDAGLPVKIIVRTTERGLSSAVLCGFNNASYDVLLCMDADLQHDPIYIPGLVFPIVNGTADFTVGSRAVEGGGVADWPMHRKIISWGATLVARPLVACSDPMSGFFCLSKKTYKKATVLNPLGYKIGLELMVRCGCEKIKEIPIIFKDRELGESKLTMKQNFLYLLHLVNLYLATMPIPFIVFILLTLTFGLYILKSLFGLII